MPAPHALQRLSTRFLVFINATVLIEGSALLLILRLAAHLRLANPIATPGWYADEGTHIEIARHLAHGEIRYLAIGQSTLLFAKLPLFDTLLAILFRFTEVGIGPLRTLTGLLGIITVALTYAVVRQISNQQVLALLAALLLAIYPQAWLYSRFGFSYNLLAPLVLLVYLGLWTYLKNSHPLAQRQRWLALAACLIGVGALADLWMFSMIAPLLVVVAMRHPWDLRWALPLTLFPWALFAGWQLLTTPDVFLFDIAYTYSRLKPGALEQQISTLAHNYAILTAQEHWMALAIVGMLLMHPNRWQRLTLICFLLPIVLIGCSEALYSLSFYYMIPLLPFVAIGVAVLLYQGLPFVWQAVECGLVNALSRWSWWEDSPERLPLQNQLSRLGALFFTGTLLLSPFLVSSLDAVQEVSRGLQTPVDPFLLNPQDAQQVAVFVNKQVAADDVVIASPALAWSITANVADFQMVAAYRGVATAHLPANVPHTRFRFDPSPELAHFVIVDNLWQNWAVYHVPGTPALITQVEQWPLVAQAGAIRVYCNAAHYFCPPAIVQS